MKAVRVETEVNGGKITEIIGEVLEEGSLPFISNESIHISEAPEIIFDERETSEEQGNRLFAGPFGMAW